MKHLTLLAAAVALLGVAACSDPQPTDVSVETAPPPMEEVPAAADQAADAAATAPAAPPPADSSTLPPEKRTSEESVRPDSETLFY